MKENEKKYKQTISEKDKKLALKDIKIEEKDQVILAQFIENDSQ